MNNNNLPEGTIISSDTLRKNRVPAGQWQTENFPILHYKNAPKVDENKWSLKVYGLVEESITYNYEQFEALEQSSVYSDIHCVTTWSRLDNLWSGVRAVTIEKELRLDEKAGFVVIHSADGYSTNLSLGDFFEEDVIFATKFNNERIDRDHGYPVRLVVPKLYLWKSAKWVTGIEFVEKDRPGFWEVRGYHNRGNPWEEERFSHS